MRGNRIFMNPNADTIANAIKVFGLFSVSFVLAMLLTPALIYYMYKYRLWRKDVRTSSPDGTKTPLFAALHKDRETRVPRLGGVLIWLTTISLALMLWGIAKFTETSFWDKANFLSRNQTWLPFPFKVYRAIQKKVIINRMDKRIINIVNYDKRRQRNALP
jgi:hypothetical protein